jgi:hypothetical protein
MKRISLIVATALAALLVAAVGTAAAGGVMNPPEPETPHVSRNCTATSPNVIGNKIMVKVTGKNVAKSQQRFANCGVARKVARGLTAIRIEKPKTLEGFRCTPSVMTGGEGTVEPQKVRYSCLFRGADTATEIRLLFTVTYNQD